MPFTGISALAADTKAASISETYECGQYEVAGTLRTRGAGVHVLEVFPGTTTHFDLVIHGLPTSDSIAYKDRSIRFKAFIYHAGTGGSARARFVGPLSSATREQVLSNPIRLLQHEACLSPSPSPS